MTMNFLKLFLNISLINLAQGGSLKRRLFDGQPSDITSNPFFVYVRGSSSRCGGIRYTDDIAITAQHCAKNPIKSYTVYTDMEWHGQIDYSLFIGRHSVMEIVHHPGYIDNKVAHWDVSIFRLNRPVSRVRLVELDRDDLGSEVGRPMKGFGWFSHKWENMNITSSIDEPLEKTMTVLDPKYCLVNGGRAHLDLNINKTDPISLPESSKSKSNQLGEYNFRPEVEFCVGAENLELGAYKGDSGGPMIFINEESGGNEPTKKPKLVGIFSWVTKYHNSTKGLLYLVRVTKFADWIDRAVDYLHHKYEPKPTTELFPFVIGSGM